MPVSRILRLDRVATALLAAAAWCTSIPAHGEEAPASSSRTGVRLVDASVRQPEPWQDDAALHAVCFSDPSTAWAVGDHGAVWCSRDGGAAWEFISVPSRAALRSVCFVDEQHGWICGGGIAPFSRTTFGVVLATEDGGRTWQVVAGDGLPWLTCIQFFDREQGVAVGAASESCPSGIALTLDGGRSWTPLEGAAPGVWTAASFAASSLGVVAGPRGRRARIVEESVAPAAPDAGDLRTVRGASLSLRGDGWLVGEGGLLLRTQNGGAGWETVVPPVSESAAPLLDLFAVHHDGPHVWLAGAPGSGVLISNDAGATWSTRPTEETTPLYALAASTEGRGLAVGALGKILLSEDHGRTWTTVRGAGRRLAALALHAYGWRIDFGQLVRDAGDRGYRMGAAVLVRRDVGPDGAAAAQEPLQLAAGVLDAFGSAALIDWRLPVMAPALERRPERLREEWSMLTDDRLDEVLESSLATLLAVWRPDVVLLDDAPENDAPTQWLHAAVETAISRAADDRAGPQDELRLPPWRVRRVFSRLPPGSHGAPAIDPFDVLIYRGATVSAAAAGPASRLRLAPESLAIRTSYRELPLDAGEGTEETSGLAERSPARPASLQDFFTGLKIAPGGPARRLAPPLSDAASEKLLAAARRRRNFHEYARRMLDEPVHSRQIAAQLPDVVAGQSPEEAAAILFDLAAEHRRRGQWDAAEQTLRELVNRYPEAPLAREGMRWLLAFWTSDELQWQRHRTVRASGGRVDAAEAGEVFSGPVEGGAPRRQDETQGAALTPPSRRGPSQAVVTVGDLQSVLAAAARPLEIDGVAPGQALGRRRMDALQRLGEAARLAEMLGRTADAEAAGPDLLFPMAALCRQTGRARQADTLYRRFAESQRGAWTRTAQGELWLLQPAAIETQSVARCPRASAPPWLDGVLSDACWERGDAIVLQPPERPREASEDEELLLTSGTSPAPGQSRDPEAFAMLAYDDRYLYLAASAPRDPRVPRAEVQYAGRPYDAPLDLHDRIAFALDSNRDYSSFYRLEVDQRGWTGDACWEDDSWNPRWHVAVDAEEGRWRLEAAIPWDELAPTPPKRGDVWGLGVQRTLPGVGWQSWQSPVGSPLRPESFGLLRFE